MGMAASQARFLGLTARQNNVEFEGQQINQQRTCLSNQSANYYSDLLGMSVPTPPSVDSYTKTVYTFNDGALTNQITSLIAQSDGKYTLSYLSQWEDDFSIVSAGTSMVLRRYDGKYLIGATELRTLGATITFTGTKAGDTTTTNNLVLAKDSNGELFYYVQGDANKTKVNLEAGASITPNTNDEYIQSLSEEQIWQLMAEEQQYLNQLNSERGTSNWQVRYVENTSTGVYTPYFYQCDGIAFNETAQKKSFTIGTSTKTNEIKGCSDCSIEKDSSGRCISITIPQYDDKGNALKDSNGNVISTTYSLTTSTVTDQDAYNDAMNQYEYDKYQYDQTIEEINAQIEIIQAQDKNLELRLKQLDTEQSAIQTEKDSVQKVIEQNTEKSFKTFA